MFGPGEYVPDPTEGIIDVNALPKPILVAYDHNHAHSPCHWRLARTSDNEIICAETIGIPFQ